MVLALRCWPSLKPSTSSIDLRWRDLTFLLSAGGGKTEEADVEIFAGEAPGEPCVMFIRRGFGTGRRGLPGLEEEELLLCNLPRAAAEDKPAVSCCCLCSSVVVSIERDLC